MRTAFIILTFNEEQHIERCIESFKMQANEIFVIDSGSTDRTVEICTTLGAKVFQNKFVNQAQQFNWALDNLEINSEWLFRIDADEYIANKDELAKLLRDVYVSNCSGFTVQRSIVFLGDEVKFGGLKNVEIVRLFKRGRGYSELRLMDEHIMVNGRIGKTKIRIIDENLNSIEWWLNKHVNYAKREASQILLDADSTRNETELGKRYLFRTKYKKFLKKHIYQKLPSYLAPLLNYIYRFVIRGGCLDLGAARDYHFLQAYWYRYLVEVYISRTLDYENVKNCSLEQAMVSVLDYQVPCTKPSKMSKK